MKINSNEKNNCFFRVIGDMVKINSKKKVQSETRHTQKEREREKEFIHIKNDTFIQSKKKKRSNFPCQTLSFVVHPFFLYILQNKQTERGREKLEKILSSIYIKILLLRD